MKPIVYSERIPLYRDYKYVPLNKNVRVLRKSRIAKYLIFLEDLPVNVIYYLITRKGFIFWAKMLGFLPIAPKDD